MAMTTKRPHRGTESVDTIERLRRTVSEVLAEPIREIVEEAVGEVVDHHIRQALSALESAPWPDVKRPRRRPVGSLERALASAPVAPPRAGTDASARDSEEPIEVPPPRVVGRTRFRTPSMPVVEERRNGRVVQRGDAAYVIGPDGRYPDGRKRKPPANARPDPVDGFRPHGRGSGMKDYDASETIGAKGDPNLKKGQRREWLLEALRSRDLDYAALTPIVYPDLGDTRYARKLTSIMLTRLLNDGAIERVPETYRPTLYRLPNH